MQTEQHAHPRSPKSSQRTVPAAVQTLITENLGLVSVHLRHRVSGHRNAPPTCDFDDLYQEGCVALVEAARRYDPACRVPFASYALFRIRRAVNHALRRADAGFDESHRGEVTQRRRATDPPGSARVGQVESTPDQVRTAQVHSGQVHSGQCRAATAACPEVVEAACDDPERFRARYAAAVAEAAREALRRSMTQDRVNMVHQLVEHRFRVFEADHKVPLRQIARNTGSSLSRVRNCELQMLSTIRRQLARGVTTSVGARSDRVDRSDPRARQLPGPGKSPEHSDGSRKRDRSKPAVGGGSYLE